MKQFFKFMLASMAGFFLTGAILMVIFFAIIISMISSIGQEETVSITPNTVLHLKLNNEIYDRAPDDPLAGLDFTSLGSSNKEGLDVILKAIKKAKEDENIKGIFLDLEDVPAGIATIEEIRTALIDFKTSKKFLYSYAEVYTQKAYYLASVSDMILMNPAGMLEFKGLSAQVAFFKGTMEKLEVEPQIIRHGKFKSAVEPFMLDKMSPANKEQTMSYIGSIWNHMVNGISTARKISVEELNLIADSLKLTNAKIALQYKMIDKSIYRDEVIALLKEKSGVGKDEELQLMTLGKYQMTTNYLSDTKSRKAKDKIAVVYAIGQIESGEGDDLTIGSERISKAIRDARLDKDVKAIVLRVNSPGGSALASEVIWREVVLAKKEKPVVVSMGDVAASGGYYIACAADKIFASPNTITGSIGVFGVIPNTEKLMKNKLGITFDGVKTNANADFGSTVRGMNTFEKMKMQMYIEEIYTTFITHVAEGRKMSTAQVDSIGQGRVWSGFDAKRIGLIDEFGGLNQAIDAAAKLGKVTEYKIVALPKPDDPVEKIMRLLNNGAKEDMSKMLGDYYEYFMMLKSIQSMQGPQARLPYLIEIR